MDEYNNNITIIYNNIHGRITVRYNISISSDDLSYNRNQLLNMGVDDSNMAVLYPHLEGYLIVVMFSEGGSVDGMSIFKPLNASGSNFLLQEDRDAINGFIDSYNHIITDLDMLGIKYTSAASIEALDAYGNIVNLPTDVYQLAATRDYQPIVTQVRPTSLPRSNI